MCASILGRLMCVEAAGAVRGACYDAFGGSHGGAHDHFWPDLRVDPPSLHYQGVISECLWTYISAIMCPDDLVSVSAHYDSLWEVWTDGRTQTLDM